MIHRAFYLSDAVVHALGWALIHSLWQGVAAALLLWLLLPRLQTAQQRYWAAYGALLAVLAAALVSFCWVYGTQPVSADAGTALAIAPSVELAQAGAPAALSGPAFWQRAAGWLDLYNPLIVTVWLFGFAFFLLQLFGGLHFIYRLRRRQNQPLASEWQEKLQHMGEQIGRSRPVALLESALVQAPMAIGFFKPLILLPIGLVNQLSPVEVEAILAHELAHITRRDWLFNLLQALIEAVFYFHPAIWWISATIRAERENCCDDAAVALTGNRLAYAKTLVRLQDMARTHTPPALALGIDGAPPLLRRRPLLLERVRRILHQPQQSASLMEKMIALAILVALITLWTVRANTPPALAEAIRDIAEKPIAWITGTPGAGQPERTWQAAADTVPKPARRQKIVREDDDQRIEMELEGGKITRLNVDGKEIPAGQYAEYQKLTDELRHETTPPPAPPAPPTLWVVPPTPPATPQPFLYRIAPAAPDAPASRISTDKDDEGNTVIRVERNGKPMEITVKDGEVWIDGNKIEAGQSLDIPGEAPSMLWQGNDGHSFWLNGNQFHFQGPDPMLIQVPQPAPAPEARLFRMPEMTMPYMSAEQLHKMQSESLQQLREQQKELEARLKEQEKLWKKNRKGWTKQQKEQYKAQEEALRAFQLSQQEQRQALDEARMERERALLEARIAQRDAMAQMKEEQRQAIEQARIARQEQVEAAREQQRAESAGAVLKNALIEDKLIGDPNNFSFELSAKEMRVNGQKQPDAVHRKYLELYQARTGKELNKKDSIRIEEEN